MLKMDPMTLFGRKIAVKKTGKKNTVLSSVYMLICSACKGVLVLVDFHMYAPNGSHRYSHPFSIFIKIGVLLRKKCLFISLVKKHFSPLYNVYVNGRKDDFCCDVNRFLTVCQLFRVFI